MKLKLRILLVFSIVIATLLGINYNVKADSIPKNFIEINAEANSTISGILGINDKETWYKINAGDTDYLDITIKNSADLITYGYIYGIDSEGKPSSISVASGIIGYGGSNLFKSLRGTVYIKVIRSSGQGSFSINVSKKTLEKKLNNSYDKATEVKSDIETDDILGINDKETWYKINAGDADYLDITIKNSADLITYGYIYGIDSEGKPSSVSVASGIIGYGGSNLFKSLRGTVYIKVIRSSGQGSFSINVSKKTLEKKLNNSYDKATEVKSDIETDDILGINDKETWYKINAGDADYLDITIKNSADLTTYGYIYGIDSEGKPSSVSVASGIIGYGGSNLFKSLRGTVYIKVIRSSGQGSFSINVSKKQSTVDNSNLSDNQKTQISIKFKTKDIVLDKNESKTLEPEIVAKEVVYSNLIWYSTNETVAKVDQKGKVTAINEGNSIIVVTTDAGGEIAICKVNVKSGGALQGDKVERYRTINIDDEYMYSQKTVSISGKEKKVILTKKIVADKSDEKLDTADKLEYVLETQNGKFKGIYSGTVKNGIPQGEGFFISSGNTLDKIFSFYGQWDEGKIFGQGIIIFSDSTKLVGNFKNNLPNGYCIEFYANGKEKYKGNFLDGNRNGYGIYTWEDGTKYEGEFSKAKLQKGDFILNSNEKFAKDNNLKTISNSNLLNMDDRLKGLAMGYLEGKVIDYIEKNCKTRYLNIGWTFVNNFEDSEDNETAIASTIVDVLMPPWVEPIFGEAPREAAVDATKKVIVAAEGVGKEVIEAIPQVVESMISTVAEIGTNVAENVIDKAKNIADSAISSGKDIIDTGVNMIKDIFDGFFH